LIPLVFWLSGFLNGEVVALVGGTIDLCGWIYQILHGIQLEVDKLEQYQVEIKKRCHHSIVNIYWQFCGILERHDIGDLLPHNLTLVIDALDAHKYLLEAVGSYDVELEVLEQGRAELDLITAEVEFFVGGEDGE
jgi:hypothetical protein